MVIMFYWVPVIVNVQSLCSVAFMWVDNMGIVIVMWTSMFATEIHSLLDTNSANK